MVHHLFRPVLQDPRIPRNGDAAHRNGYALADNPFPADNPRHYAWASDWKFRHDHCLPTASDAEGGDYRPTHLTRAPALANPPRKVAV